MSSHLDTSDAGSVFKFKNNPEPASSDDEKLVIETPKKRASKKCKIDIPETDKKILKEIEEAWESKLDEKAARTKLKGSHVKNILKQVVTNEHVLAFVKNVENPDEDFDLQYVPKLTRAKAKELAVEAPFPGWALSKKANKLSETQVLISAVLPEDDSSEEEYDPVNDEHLNNDDESEDENNASIQNENSTINNTQTTQSTDCGTQTYWNENGLIESPPPTNENNSEPDEPPSEGEANIALRTRSKLCLSDTPLEDIEESFVPPDITLGMYDMDCDDEDWKNFLKEFTRPLEEVIQVSQEDEEHDPEYNVLADEDIDEVDLEELRADRGVKITRKELNELIAELVDYADNFNNYFPQQANNTVEPPKTDVVKEVQNPPVCSDVNSNFNLMTNVVIINYKHLIMDANQKAIFEQQIRQHVQLLAQSFMLTHTHPELNEISEKCKLYLELLKEETIDKSFYKNTNLDNALTLVNEWEEKLKSDSPVINDYKSHWIRTICEAKDAKAAGIVYIPHFHQLFLDTIAHSSVFMYPSLLPRIPYTDSNSKVLGFNNSENALICLGLEQFIPFLKLDKKNVKGNGEVPALSVCYYIQKFMMPSKNAQKLYKHVINNRNSSYSNPIKTFFDTNKVPCTYHLVVPVNDLQKIAPCTKNPDELPYQWRNYLFPDSNDPPVTNSSTSITRITKPPAYNKKFVRRTQPQPNLKTIKTPISKAPDKNTPYNAFINLKDVQASTPKCKKSLFNVTTSAEEKLYIPPNLLKIKFNSSIFNNMPKDNEMVSSMPTLNAGMATTLNAGMATTQGCTFNSPKTQEHEISNIALEESNSDEIIGNKEEVVNLMETNSITNEIIEISSSTNLDAMETSVNDAGLMEKDNLDDINALVVASSTIKSAIKRRPTGLEKKRAKMKRDFTDNLRLLAEEDNDVITEKRNRFIQAFYDKVQDTLTMEDFHKFMATLNDYDEAKSSPKLLYNQVSEILGDKHPDIMNEFLLFFDSLQAKALGKLIPYLIVSNMSLFLRKLEMFFQDQPSQVRKIYRALTDLSGKEGISLGQVKSTVLPLLKGNGLLTDWFLQIFPMEKPPARLLNGAWENIHLSKDKDDTFETVILPEVEDPYGGPNCICSCHNVDDATFKARSRHCTPCGTKFMQGRVYVQTGKGLRLAKISFDDTSIDHKARLSFSSKKRTDGNSVKQISPGKDSQDETRQSSDDEPDKKHQRIVKSPKKRKPKKNSKLVDKSSMANAKTRVQDAFKHEVNETIESVVKPVGLNSVDIIDLTPKLLSDEAQEWDCNTSIESVEIRMSPEPCASAESESECCEELETSQDNNSDSDVSCNDTENNGTSSAGSSAVQWTREEDKVILETFQKEEELEVAFERILEKLNGRSLEQVKERFDVLINFLKKMSNSR